jgi:hypothetical protein
MAETNPSNKEREGSSTRPRPYIRITKRRRAVEVRIIKAEEVWETSLLKCGGEEYWTVA